MNHERLTVPAIGATHPCLDELAIFPAPAPPGPCSAAGSNPTSPATSWLFAEGAQGFFHTFLAFANDLTIAVDVTVTFLLEGGGTVQEIVTVPSHSRRSLYAGDIPALANRTFAVDITATAPIVAERAMYFSNHVSLPFQGGHASAGVTEPRTTWLLAEGATGPFFDCYVLVSNPGATTANVTLDYSLPSGDTVRQTVVVPARGRQTINVATVDPRLASTTISTAVESNVGIVVERTMYWPGNVAQGWQEAHNNFGVTDLGLRWGIADGCLGGPRGHDAYIVLANPHTHPAEVEVRYLQVGMKTAVIRRYTVPRRNRVSIHVAQDVPELADGSFSAEIKVLNLQPIAVENTTYWNADGDISVPGTNVTATRLPPP